MGLVAALPAAGESSPRTGNSAAPTSISVNVTGLKSNKGVLRYCITPRGGGFPECDGGHSVNGSAAISGLSAHFSAKNLAPGDYAIAVFHDKNANSRLDTFAGIPREGYGFSNNPGFMPRAPKFEEAAIRLNRSMETEIRMRYIL